jgi:hypothetical protein
MRSRGLGLPIHKAISPFNGINLSISAPNSVFRRDIDRGFIEMMSKLPIDLEKNSKKAIDMEILRAAIVAELDAINLYEQFAATTDDKKMKEVLLDIAKEEKTHVGEFQALLLERDKEQVEELKRGKEEVEKE